MLYDYIVYRLYDDAPLSIFSQARETDQLAMFNVTIFINKKGHPYTDMKRSLLEAKVIVRGKKEIIIIIYVKN